MVRRCPRGPEKGQQPPAEVAGPGTSGDSRVSGQRWCEHAPPGAQVQPAARQVGALRAGPPQRRRSSMRMRRLSTRTANARRWTTGFAAARPRAISGRITVVPTSSAKDYGPNLDDAAFSRYATEATYVLRKATCRVPGHGGSPGRHIQIYRRDAVL